jgi:hypothetical protein
MLETIQFIKKNSKMKTFKIVIFLLFCMCLMLFPTLMEVHRLKLLENRMVRRKPKPKTAEMIRGWRKLHNKQPYTLYRFKYFLWLVRPSGPKSPDFWGSAITLSHTTHGRTTLAEELLHCNIQDSPSTDIPPGEFDPAIPASERPQTNLLDRVATRIGV